MLEYLFWVWDPELPGSQTETERVLQQGFMDGETYKVFAILGSLANGLCQRVILQEKYLLAINPIIHNMSDIIGRRFFEICHFDGLLRYITHNSSILRYCDGKLDCSDLNVLNFWAL